jgi:hypothetical protein
MKDNETMPAGVDPVKWQQGREGGVVVNWNDGHQPRILCWHTPTCPSANSCFDKSLRLNGFTPKRRSRFLKGRP